MSMLQFRTKRFFFFGLNHRCRAKRHAFLLFVETQNVHLRGDGQIKCPREAEVMTGSFHDPTWKISLIFDDLKLLAISFEDCKFIR